MQIPRIPWTFHLRWSRHHASRYLVLLTILFPEPAATKTSVSIRAETELAQAGDCQDRCLMACPKRVGSFGTSEIDKSCATKCLMMSCDIPAPPTTVHPTGQDGPVESFTIWINAFIPNEHPSNPGFIRRVPNNPAKTMIPGPNIPYTNASLPLIGGHCYNTNNRGFSADRSAKSKISSSITFKAGPADIRDVHIATPVLEPTEEYDCTTGRVTCTKTASSQNVRFFMPVLAGSVVTISTNGSASNPCVRAPASMTPSIKYQGVFSIDLVAGTIGFRGKVASFPSYEAYVSRNGGAPIAIFRQSPAPGSTAWALFLSTPVNTTVKYR